MKSLKKMIALVIAAVMVLGMAMPAMAEETGKTVTVTIHANGGTFATGTGVQNSGAEFVATAKTEPDATTISIGRVDNIPTLTAPTATQTFSHYSGDAAGATENLFATINGSEGNYTADFYANWETVPTNNRTLDDSISVSGLESKDKVNFYQILVWDENATDTKGWIPAPAYRGYKVNESDTIVAGGLTKADVQKILGLDATGTPVTITDANKDQFGIDQELASRLAGLSATAKYPNIAESSGVAAQANPEAGLYMAIITPGQSGVIYNPVFVGADYDGNSTNTYALKNLEASYSPKSIAKKNKITLDKTAETTEDDFEDKKPESVAAGDTVTFRVETTIPTFADNYTQAKFFVEDHLSKGLTLNTESIKVLPGWYSECADATAQTAFNAQNQLSKNYAITKDSTVHNNTDGYELTSNSATGTQDWWKVNFATDYLLRDGATAQKITVVYTATVTTDAPRSINLENNTAEVHFSNSPSDGTGAGTLKDETKHYTFDIDANILGPKGDETPGSHPWQTTEVVKVGLDDNGNEITKTTTLHGVTYDGSTTGEQTIGALQGAEFVLYKAVKNASTGAFEFVEAPANIYTNNIMKTDYKIVSDATGRLTIHNKDANSDPATWTAETNPGIRGLDIGVYYLKETKAPDGYIKAQDPVKIEIYAPQQFDQNGNFVDNAYWKETTYTDPDNPAADAVGVVEWKVRELIKYEVKINEVTTANYTFTNAKSVEDTEPTGSVDQGDTITGADGAIGTGDGATQTGEAYGKITNVQGTELPSTGGIGTTIFYTIGGILIIAAGILLVSKRRAY